MARHRGTYKPDHPEPYEISQSALRIWDPLERSQRSGALADC